MSRKERITSPEELLQKYPLSSNLKAFVSETRHAVRKIVSGEDKRLLLIVGPCSIHHLDSALEYARRLKKLALEVQDHFLIIMRSYLEKPRTTIGWKGLLHDPFLNGSQDINAGLALSRKLLIELASMQIGTATEFLEFISPSYLEDLISWGSIGARTCTSQPHRQLASGLPMPIGFKNSLDGDPLSAVHGVLAAKVPQICTSLTPEGHISFMRTSGNPDGHIVLRGSNQKSNYDKKSIHEAVGLLIKSNLPPKLIVDCSHGNCQKNFNSQEVVFNALIQQVVEGNDAIAGLMLESHLIAGSQSHHFDQKAIHNAISLTDPCLGWQATEALIKNGFHMLSKSSQSTQPCCFQHLRSEAPEKISIL